MLTHKELEELVGADPQIQMLKQAIGENERQKAFDLLDELSITHHWFAILLNAESAQSIKPWRDDDIKKLLPLQKIKSVSIILGDYFSRHKPETARNFYEYARGEDPETLIASANGLIKIGSVDEGFTRLEKAVELGSRHALDIGWELKESQAVEWTKGLLEKQISSKVRIKCLNFLSQA